MVAVPAVPVLAEPSTDPVDEETLTAKASVGLIRLDDGLGQLNGRDQHPERHRLLARPDHGLGQDGGVLGGQDRRSGLRRADVEEHLTVVVPTPVRHGPELQALPMEEIRLRGWSEVQVMDSPASVASASAPTKE